MPFTPKKKTGTVDKQAKPKAHLTVTLKWMSDRDDEVKEADVIRKYAEQADLKPTAYVYGCVDHALNTGPLVDAASEFEDAVKAVAVAEATKDRNSIAEAKAEYAEAVQSITEQYGAKAIPALEAALKAISG